MISANLKSGRIVFYFWHFFDTIDNVLAVFLILGFAIVIVATPRERLAILDVMNIDIFAYDSLQAVRYLQVSDGEEKVVAIDGTSLYRFEPWLYKFAFVGFEYIAFAREFEEDAFADTIAVYIEIEPIDITSG